MEHKLILASAGAGKSSRIAKHALEMSARGKTILILTYTENNQKELLNKICQINKHKPSNIIIKGWFTFLLKDMIRPYQSCIFQERIKGIFFNASDPHKNNGKTIKGRSEETNGNYNPLYFLTKSEHRAHTTYLSKLAVRIHEKTIGETSQRLSEIYDVVFIDEIQDLIGWDFDVISAIAKLEKCALIFVGDFRQTIYSTSNAQKKPKTNIEKLEAFKKIGFEPEHMNISWRCLQPICDFADLVHANENYYQPTSSQVTQVPDDINKHQGIFVVSTGSVSEYLARYSPVILRLNKKTNTQLCDGHKAFNFGEAKGLGFDRVLILPTEKHAKFLSGNKDVFNGDKTDEARNKFYVAITRAKYSVAFLYDGSVGFESIQSWTSG